MTDFQTGLLISVVGLLVTFVALGIFIGVIILLQKLFPPKAEAEEEAVEEVKPAQIETKEDSDAEAIAAALAAVSYLRSQRAGQLGATLATGPGPYWTSN